MGLYSKLFCGDPKLEAAAVSDPAHIMSGASGPHVSKIQMALILLDGAVISADEVQQTFYGTSTSDAVLAYKRKRGIVNLNYQTQADNIVGKMTMASLDREMLKQERAPRAPVRIEPKSYRVLRPLGSPTVLVRSQDPRPLGLNFAFNSEIIQAALRIEPFDMRMARFSTGWFTVIDGTPGTVEVIGPRIIRIQPTGVTFPPPGFSFPVTDNQQVFKVSSELRSGTTTIRASNLFGSNAFLNVTVEGPSPSPRLTGRIDTAPDGARGFDTSTPISAALATQFHNDGFDFCLRYISFSGEQHAPDLTNSEANDILDAGLALMPVQHVLNPGWMPTGALGTTFGVHAVNNALSVGFPAGVNVWLDLEGVGAGCGADDVIAYCTNWANQVEGAGYVAGIYIGFNCVLDGEQLSHLPFVHYWKDPGNRPAIAGQGYQMIQTSNNESRHNISIDQDRIQIDSFGVTPRWLTR